MSETTNELEKLDITTLVDAFLHSLKRLWVIVLILSLGLGAFSYFRTQSTYVPAYKAEATVAVYASDDGTTINSRSAQQLGTVFPYILTSGVLKDVIMEEMGVKTLPGSIKVTNVEGTNLLTISVSSNDPDLSYKTLLSIIKNYPKVAEYVVGYTTMEIIDDSGVPSDSGKTVAVRGNALKGAAIGFVASMGLVFLHMLLNRTVRTSRDVKAFSTVEHLGTLPVYKKKKRKDTVSSISILEHNVQQDYLEAIRLIRTRIMRKLENNGHKVLMVTSSVPGEGKSTIAANLAISLSGKDKRVIIVDCDLRNPSLQEIFKVEKKHPTLLDVINHKALIEDALVSFDNYGIQLNVLFGSPDNPTNHSEILGSQRMNEVIKQLKAMADVVILDTPPSAMLVDAMLVAKYVDEAVYVIMADYARTSVIAEGLRELKSAGIEISGFVLNGSKDSLGGYGYHSYGYGSHYYEYKEEQRSEQKDFIINERPSLENVETEKHDAVKAEETTISINKDIDNSKKAEQAIGPITQPLEESAKEKTDDASPIQKDIEKVILFPEKEEESKSSAIQNEPVEDSDEPDKDFKTEKVETTQKQSIVSEPKKEIKEKQKPEESSAKPAEFIKETPVFLPKKTLNNESEPKKIEEKTSVKPNEVKNVPLVISEKKIEKITSVPAEKKTKEEKPAYIGRHLKKNK